MALRGKEERKAMKVFERIIEARLREKVDIDNMQFDFSAGKGTTDAILIVRQLQEKYLEKKGVVDGIYRFGESL